MQDFLHPLKRQAWQRWFTEPVPMLGNQTPTEAARNVAGRQKIEELLSFYDSMNSGNFLNVPTAWAKWRLGMGPGSTEEFVEEESIYNSTPPRQTSRTPSHEAKLDKRQGAMFVPQRCEMEGCTKKGDDVKKCNGCKLVNYCGKEHQSQDWPRHKHDCKHLKNSTIRRRYFSTAAELAKYPIGCFPLSAPVPDKKLKCVTALEKIKVGVGVQSTHHTR